MIREGLLHLGPYYRRPTGNGNQRISASPYVESAGNGRVRFRGNAYFSYEPDDPDPSLFCTLSFETEECGKLMSHPARIRWPSNGVAHWRMGMQAGVTRGEESSHQLSYRRQGPRLAGSQAWDALFLDATSPSIASERSSC